MAQICLKTIQVVLAKYCWIWHVQLSAVLRHLVVSIYAGLVQNETQTKTRRPKTGQQLQYLHFQKIRRDCASLNCQKHYGAGMSEQSTWNRSPLLRALNKLRICK
jgi:hypothetical protein